MPKTITATHKDTGEKVKFSWDGPGKPSREQLDQIFEEKKKRNEGLGSVKAPPDNSLLSRGATGYGQALLGPNGGGPLESMTQPFMHPIDTLKGVMSHPGSLISPENIGGMLALMPFGAAMSAGTIPEGEMPVKPPSIPSNAPKLGGHPGLIPKQEFNTARGVNPVQGSRARMPPQVEPIQSSQGLNSPILPQSKLQPQRSTRLNKAGQPESLEMTDINAIHPEAGNQIYPDKVQSYKVNPPSVENAPVLRSDNTVFDGHHRVSAAAENGVQNIPTWKPSELANSFVPKNYDKILKVMTEGGGLDQLPELLTHAKDYAPSHLENDLRGFGLPEDQILNTLRDVHGQDLVKAELDYADRGQSPLLRSSPMAPQ